jgi:hypothetical protein
VFDALGDVGQAGKTSAQLAESAGADQRLVGMASQIHADMHFHLDATATQAWAYADHRKARFLRHLAANGTIREVELDTYASTRLSSSFRQQSFKDAIYFM